MAARSTRDERLSGVQGSAAVVKILPQGRDTPARQRKSNRGTDGEAQRVIEYLAFNGEDVGRREALDAIEGVAHLREGETKVYRVMRLTPGSIDALGETRNLGLYWSEKPDIARDNLLDDGKGEWFLLEGLVNASSVDIIETAGARLLNKITSEWQDENEVRLLRAKPIRLLSIQDDHGCCYRADLSNKILAA